MNPVPPTTLTPLLRPQEAKGPPSRCLLALSDFEVDLFLKNGLYEELKGIVTEARQVSSSDFTREEWATQLDQFQPNIVITGWSTYPLPQSLDLSRSSLQYVCSITGSIRNKVSRRLVAEGLKVSNWGNSVSLYVAESALMLCLMSLRRASHWHHVMHNLKGWSSDVSNSGQLSLRGRKIGIHGFGNVARAFTRLVAPFQPTLTTYCPYASDEQLNRHGVRRADSLEDLFSKNEIIVEMAALTEATKGSITEELLRLLPSDGVFVNVGRGAVVDEEALTKLAEEGRLRVALDVFNKEPLSRDSRLREIPHVILTPHQAGPTADRMADVGRFAIENIRRHLNGETILAQIDVDFYDSMT